MGRHVALLVMLVAASALAGCAGNDEEVQEAQVAEAVALMTDVAGDAYARNGEYLQAVMPRACGALPDAARAPCHDAADSVAEAAPLPKDAGMPDPQMDLLSGTLQETSEAVVVSIEIAELDQAWSDVVADEDSVGGYSACWDANGEADEGIECTTLVGYRDNGLLVLEAYFDRYSLDCNHWWWCSWQVDAEVEYGSPATIRLTIPRAVMGSGSAGDGVLDSIHFESFRAHGTADASWGAHAGGEQDGGRVGGGTGHYHPDRATADGAFQFTLAPLAPAASAKAFVDESGETGRADADVWALELVEGTDTLTAAVQFGSVEEEVRDHQAYAAIGLASRRVFMMGYDAAGGAVEPWAGVCSDDDCTEWVEFPVEVERVVGAPGWVNFTVARADLDDPQPGDLVNLFYAAASYWEHSAPMGEAGTAGVDARAQHRGDWIPPAPPIWLG